MYKSKISRALISSPLFFTLSLIAGLTIENVQTVQAATLTVNSLLDSGENDDLCQLREAMQAVNKGVDNPEDCVNTADEYRTNDTIQFDTTLTGTITVLTALPTIMTSLTITAPDQFISVNRSMGSFPIFNIDSGNDNQVVSISGITIDGEKNTESSNTGSGIELSNGDTLNLTEVAIINNQSNEMSDGAGIRNNGGTLNITNSTISENNADNNGGGIYQVSGTSVITNSTISGNSTNKLDGAGIYVNTGSVTLNNVTLASNNAENNGGGIHVSSSSADPEVSATVNVSNTIIANNGANNEGADCHGNLVSMDYNLIEDTTGCVLTGTTTNNIIGADPELEELQDNGGATLTMAIAETSPALEAGNPNVPDGVFPNCQTVDQRNIERPQHDNCDIGAFEIVAVCGDAIIDEGETCDDGDANSDTVTGACNTNCQLSSCGNNIIDDGEECDNGDDNNDIDANACRTNCLMPTCGDAVVDAGEACDDGNNDNTDACLDTCTFTSCGNGVIDAGETCDDANADNTDDCLSTCVLPSCGDSIESGGEECDDGNANDFDNCSNACEVNVSLDPDQNPDNSDDDGNGCILSKDSSPDLLVSGILLLSLAVLIWRKRNSMHV